MPLVSQEMMRVPWFAEAMKTSDILPLVECSMKTSARAGWHLLFPTLVKHAAMIATT